MCMYYVYMYVTLCACIMCMLHYVGYIPSYHSIEWYFCLKKLTEWLGCNQLSLNVNKTKFMLFHSNRRAVNYLNILINNINMENVAEFNFLGIQLSQSLKWKTHQNHVSLKLTKTIGILNRLKHELSLSILKTIYNTLFLPHLNYGILLWVQKLKVFMNYKNECYV